MAIYGVINIFLGFPYAGYSPIEQTLQNISNITTFQIIMTSTSTLVGVLVMTLFFNFFSKCFSVVHLNLIGLIFSLLGYGCKFFMEKNFWFCIAGQFLLGVGVCFIINIELSFAFSYFSKKYRSMSISILTLANMIGKFNKVRDPAILTFYFLSQTTPT
jgi:hypothetical protein